MCSNEFRGSESFILHTLSWWPGVHTQSPAKHCTACFLGVWGISMYVTHNQLTQAISWLAGVRVALLWYPKREIELVQM